MTTPYIRFSHEFEHTFSRLVYSSQEAAAPEMNQRIASTCTPTSNRIRRLDRKANCEDIRSAHFSVSTSHNGVVFVHFRRGVVVRREGARRRFGDIGAERVGHQYTVDNKCYMVKCRSLLILPLLLQHILLLP